MKAQIRLIAALAMSLMAVPAVAEPVCNVPANEWSLELARVERESGKADVNAVVKALGTRATFRGGVRDPAHPKRLPRAVLVGSTDGAGLNVSLEKGE